MEKMEKRTVSNEYVTSEGFANYIIAFIGLMVITVMVFNAVLPTVNTALYGTGAAAANLSVANLALAGLISLLVVVAVIMFVLRIMGGQSS